MYYTFPCSFSLAMGLHEPERCIAEKNFQLNSLNET